jgi:hypothetical protein
MHGRSKLHVWRAGATLTWTRTFADGRTFGYQLTRHPSGDWLVFAHRMDRWGDWRAVNLLARTIPGDSVVVQDLIARAYSHTAPV